MIDTSALSRFTYPAAELSESDLLVRRGRITSSVAAMILGESEFGGPLRAYREILGLETWKGNPSTMIGKIDEPKIGALHQMRHKTATLYRAGTRVHPSLDWLAASIDFLVVDGDRTYILEAKSTDERNRHYWGAPGTAEVPAGYRVQVAIQLACWGLDRAVFGLLIGRDDYREYVVERSPEFEANVFAVLDRFLLDHLVPRIPPKDADLRAYAQTVYPEPTEALRIADEEHETAAWFYEVKKAAAERARANAAYDEAIGGLCVQIGASDGIVVDGEKVTWKRRANARERVPHVPPAWHRTDGKESDDVETAA